MLLLNVGESLEVVIKFLSLHCSETESDNINLILKNLIKIRDGKQSYLTEWTQYLDRARIINLEKNNQAISREFTEQEVFDAMVILLEDNYKKTKSDDLGGCLSELGYVEYGETADSAMAELWQKFLHEAKGIQN